MATLLECSVPTIQAIELGKLKMSIKLAGLVFNQTGVSLGWLMQDDVSNRPIDCENQPYTRETFEQKQAMLNGPPEDSSDVRRNVFHVRASFRSAVEQLAILYSRAYRDNGVHLCDFKISRALDELIEESIGFGRLTPEEKDRIARLRLHDSQPQHLLAAVQLFIDETDAIFQKRIAEFEPTPHGGLHPADANKLPPRMRKVTRRKAPPKRK